ncbi:MAG: hypothetical protein A3K19_14820 [Lentisphaerae bacterium RIFOXYB12_FULL_65_16]|nr:MAG: hypothetical protein A3K19_14820 [Lentisphaerae bacterium RIFOXYB12_FULL_65_16]
MCDACHLLSRRDTTVNPAQWGDCWRNRETVEYYKTKTWDLRYALDIIERFDLPGKTLLDIGTGIGTLLRLAAERGFSASGLELDASAVATAKEVHGLDVWQGDLQTFAFTDSDRFAAITLMNTLQVLDDLNGCLTKVRHLLQDDGLLLIQTNNLPSFRSRYGKALRLLNPASLLTAGLERLDIADERVFEGVNYLFAVGNVRRLLNNNGYRVLNLHLLRSARVRFPNLENRRLLTNYLQTVCPKMVVVARKA